MMVKEKTNNTLIKVEGLKLAYGSHLVLENINFEVEQGRCLVVMGGSGCGKSTLLKSMVGLLPPINGKVVIDGEDLWCDQITKNNLVLRKLGVLFQEELCGVP